MADPYADLRHTLTEITTPSDLTVRVIEYDTDDNLRAVCEFKVQQAVLTRDNAYFSAILRSGFKEAEKDHIDLTGDSGKAMKVWFELLHNTLKDDSYELETADLWQMLLAAHKYGFNPKTDEARSFFGRWYSANVSLTKNYLNCQMLLLPTYTFEHAVGFAVATTYLVYNGDLHITEERPVGFGHEHLRLDQSIIQQLNAAKGRLRNVLHQALYGPIEDLLKHARCDHKEKALYRYEKALQATGAWPLEAMSSKKSINNFLLRLEGFTTHYSGQDQGSSCWECNFPAERVVRKAITDCRNYFDGLCLDCMSESKFRDEDKDYWHHVKSCRRWDSNCRITHSQPSRYFSFQGRRAKLLEWENNRTKDRR